MRLVDSHAHLDDPRFELDRAAVLDRARAVGVEAILTIGCLGEDTRSADSVLRILDCYDWIGAAFGVHPHDARFLDDRLEKLLEELLSHPRALGLGEIGLDFFYDNSPREAQLEAFQRQLEMARRLLKPVVIHTRDAEEDTRRILSGHFSGAPFSPGVLHCFTGSRQLAEEALELGFSISFGGIVTFKKAGSLRDVLKIVPLNRLLIETDSPYLAPVPYRGKRNEPAFVREVAEEASRVLGLPPSEVAGITGSNFSALFGWGGRL